MQDSATPLDLVIGILGGMGPIADIDFISKLIAATPAAHESEYLRVLLDSNPKIPDRQRAIAAVKNGLPVEQGNPGPVLADMARQLERAGATLIVMASNTAHAFESDIRAAITVPFVSIIEEACDAACQGPEPGRRLGILATPGCLETGLYQRALARRHCESLYPSPAKQRRLMQLIHQIKLGNADDDLRHEMRSFAEALIDAGADAIIAGCTEIPLALSGQSLPRPLLDATDILARRCVLYAKHRETIPARIFPLTSTTLHSSRFG